MRGSSPLARGLQQRHGVPARTLGIIPARAGFTPARVALWRRCWDHPRSRGVYPPLPLPPLPPGGSSPLARGLQVGEEESTGERGIIPARAGFTLLPLPFSPGERDHPRSRGVYEGLVK